MSNPSSRELITGFNSSHQDVSTYTFPKEEKCIEDAKLKKCSLVSFCIPNIYQYIFT